MWCLFPLRLTHDVPVAFDKPAGVSYYDYMGVQYQQMAYCLCYKNQNPGPKAGRKFHLDRSVFDLVKTNQFLELTDPKLLCWYLSLPVEDRKLIQDEGGFHQFLKYHPALELSRHYVYVKYDNGVHIRSQPIMSSSVNVCRSPTFYGVTVCGTCGISCPSGAKWCGHCATSIVQQPLCPEDQDFILPTNHTKHGADCQREQKQLGHQCPTNQFVKPQQSFQTAYNSSYFTEQQSHKDLLSSQLWKEGASWQDSRSSSVAVCKDPAAQASFSLDMELERHRQTGNPESWSQASAVQGQSGYYKYEETSQLDSQWLPTEQEAPSSVYYSFDSTQMEWSDTSVRQPGKPEQDDSLSATKGSSELPSTVETTPGTAEGTEDSYHNYPCDCANLTYSVHDCSANSDSECEEQSESFHSIMKDDNSILMCKKNSEGLKSRDSRVHSAPVQASNESGEAEPSFVKISTAEKSTLTHSTTRDALVGTESELAWCTSAATQTTGLATTDKHVITEVHMTDLDYLAEEFIKLKAAQEELKELKGKMSSSGTTVKKDCGAEGGCDCAQRAQRAELCLLALQYSMCRQHCWRLCYTSAEGERLTLMKVDMNQYWSEAPPAKLVSALQRLESSYNEMREKILAGVPLDQLKPLSVDSQKLTTETHYIPAQIIGDALGNEPASISNRSSQQPHRQDKNIDGGNGGPCGQNGKGSKEGQRRKDVALQPRVIAIKLGKAVSLLSQQSAAACEELNSSEAWYDAYEELEPAAAGVTGQASTVMKKEPKNATGSASEVKETRSSFLCVTDLPNAVTEGDVMLLFEKYHASEVHISTFSNDMRVAIVTVSGPQSAKAAVTELNGCSMQGRVLHVEHISGPREGSQSQDQQHVSSSTNRPGSSQDVPTPQTPKTSPSNTTVKLVPQQRLRSSIERRKVVCISPTAKGTCVPQHYATMGSFDTLMAELTRRHPEVGRQRIMDALLELKSRHQGVLSGLPLRTIMKMTSELLTRPTNTTTS